MLGDRRKLCGDDICRKAIDDSLRKEALLDRLLRKME
jgi:hypothetical protein